MAKYVFAFLVLIGIVIPCFAQGNYSDYVTITTYYPSPYGSYRQLEVRRGLTYRPLAAVPTPSKDDREGELIYVDANPSDTTPGEFQFYGGGAWQKFGGGADGKTCVPASATIDPHAGVTQFTATGSGYVTGIYYIEGAHRGSSSSSMPGMTFCWLRGCSVKVDGKSIAPLSGSVTSYYSNSLLISSYAYSDDIETGSIPVFSRFNANVTVSCNWINTDCNFQNPAPRPERIHATVYYCLE